MTHIQLSSLLVIRLNVAVAEQLKSLGLFDVMALPLELKQLYDLRTEPHKFLRVLYEMLEQQHRAATPINFEQFAEQFTDAEVYENCWEAFTREVSDFFREPMRLVIVEVFRMLELAEAERVDDLMATIQASLLPIESTALGEFSGGSPELSESIRDLSHCDNLTIWPPDADATNGQDTPDSNPVGLETTSTPTETLPKS